jgi:hypothetical protein
MADPTYLDRLYNEIGQYGDRVRGTIFEPDRRVLLNKVISNWTTPYQSIEEQARLQAQQTKGDYMAMQEAAMPADQGYQQPVIPGLDPRSQYIQYLQENAEALKNPEYLPPTEEQWQQYFMRGEAPEKVVANVPKAIPVAPAAAEVAAAMPRQTQPGSMPAPAGMPQEMEAQQPGQQRPMTIREQIAALPYEADRLEATRKVIEQARAKEFEKGLKYIADTYGDIGAPNAKNAREALKETIDIKLPMPKPVEETAQYKAAEKNWDGGLRDRQKRLVSAYNVVKESQKLMDTNPELALRFMRSSMAKPLQSIISSDAIQVSEMLIQYEDLLNAPVFAQLTGKQPTNPAILFNKYLSLDDKEQSSFKEKLIKAMVEANPERALQTAIYTVNSYVDGYNNDINDQVVSPTSPSVAKRLGAVQFQPLKEKQPKSEVQVVRPRQQAGAAVQKYTPEQARAELQRRQAERASQQVDLTGKQGF